ncbi:hypothetical protein [Paracoccus sp. SSJ]|uniref:hypothetical protein n=1 Tax=Paracoccus sp. SSJ TaxID=3050636 RepID=UPI0033071B19
MRGTTDLVALGSSGRTWRNELEFPLAETALDDRVTRPRSISAWILPRCSRSRASASRGRKVPGRSSA